MTAKTIADAALALMAHANSAGAVDENRESRYYGLAPAYITVLQDELALALNMDAVPQPVTNLSQTLEVDGDSAARVMPAGLAMHFALIDRDADKYNYFTELYYGRLLPSVKPDESQLTDAYSVAGDPTMQ